MDNITATVKGRNKEVAETAKKVMKKPKEEVERTASSCQFPKMERKGRAR